MKGIERAFYPFRAAALNTLSGRSIYFERPPLPRRLRRSLPKSGAIPPDDRATCSLRSRRFVSPSTPVKPFSPLQIHKKNSPFVYGITLKNNKRQQILHSSFFILHFSLYLCTQICEKDSQTIAQVPDRITTSNGFLEHTKSHVKHALFSASYP